MKLYGGSDSAVSPRFLSFLTPPPCTSLRVLPPCAVIKGFVFYSRLVLPFSLYFYSLFFFVPIIYIGGRFVLRLLKQI